MILWFCELNQEINQSLFLFKSGKPSAVAVANEKAQSSDKKSSQSSLWYLKHYNKTAKISLEYSNYYVLWGLFNVLQFSPDFETECCYVYGALNVMLNMWSVATAAS